MHLTAKYFVLWCLIFTVKSAYTQSCDYVKNLRVFYKDAESSSEWQHIYVNGCIDQSAFNNIEVREIKIECKELQLDQIGPNFVNNLKSLETLTITKCKFETIEPGAFANLPKLAEVVIFETPLKEIRKGVFNGLSTLNTIHLYNNKISYIDDDAFANLPRLTFIDLNDNECDYMRREWFTNTTSVTIFFMARNNLHQIPPRMFLGWSKLEWFNLNTNKISRIHDEAFKDIAPVIKNLDLHLNRLTTISLKSFSDPVHIEILRLSANLLNYLSEEFLRKANVNYLYIHGNPFKCPCLDRIHSVLHEKGGVIVDYPDDPYFYKPCYSANAPVCIMPSRTRYCQDNVDEEVTETYLTYLKNIGYDHFHALGEKCAMFDV